MSRNSFQSNFLLTTTATLLIILIEFFCLLTDQIKFFAVCNFATITNQKEGKDLLSFLDHYLFGSSSYVDGSKSHCLIRPNNFRK